MTTAPTPSSSDDAPAVLVETRPGVVRLTLNRPAKGNALGLTMAREVLAAIAEANGGHQVAYGEDVYTARLQEVVAQHFGEDATVWPMFNGTGANVVGLQAMLPRWGAVICADTAHIHVDEGGAPEKSAGIKLLPVATDDGKLTPELIAAEAVDPAGHCVPHGSVGGEGGGCGVVGNQCDLREDFQFSGE